jgi:putative transposase
MQLEQLLVRYLVDHYNQALDARMGDQTRLGRGKPDALPNCRSWENASWICV